MVVQSPVAQAFFTLGISIKKKKPNNFFPMVMATNKKRVAKQMSHGI